MKTAPTSPRNYASVGVLLIALYLLVAGLPLVLAVSFRPHSGESFLGDLGMDLGLAAIGMIAAQFALSARWHWAERPFGLDAVLRFHRAMGTLAFVLLAAHPVVLAADGHGWSLLYSPGVPWFIWLGRIALALLLVHVAVSIWRKTFKLTFEQWRAAHDALALTILGLVFVHSWFAGDEDVSGAVMKTLWFALPLAATAIYVDSRFLRPMRLRKRAYTVTDVITEAPGVWTVKLAPPAGAARFDYQPGQFQFLTFHRGGGVPTGEEHHWTISSSPTEPHVVSSTIKDSGDFTSTIGKTKIGDTATVDAPYGRFSYALHDTPRDLVFVVGGIGITPPMAMIRHLRDCGDDRRVLLVYGNKTEQDIVFREELDQIAAGDAPRLKVVHVLSQPGDDWDGEAGRIDPELIEREVEEFLGGGLEDKTFLVCGPGALIDKTIAGLKGRGVPASHVLAEAYSLAGGSMPRDGSGQRLRLAKLAAAVVILASITGAALVRSGGEAEHGRAAEASHEH